MSKKIRSLYILSFFMLFSHAGAEVYFSVHPEIYSRYVFRGYSPEHSAPSASLGGSAYFPGPGIGVSQLCVSSLEDVSAYHELLTMFNYYHYFNDRFMISGGIGAYFFPGVENSPPFTLEFNLRFSGTGGAFPYTVESYVDPVLKSWYWKCSVAHTFDVFLPVRLALNTGANALPHERYGKNIPAGLSDISADLSTYISLKNWQFTPKLSYILSLNKTMREVSMFQASLNTAYVF